MRDFGKKFEELTKAVLESEGCCTDRLPDQMSGKAGSANPSDFTAYKKPYYFYIECKSCQEVRFDIRSRISEFQWLSLLSKGEYDGVYAGYLIWFVKEDKVFWVPAKSMLALYEVQKSFTSADLSEWGVAVDVSIRQKYPRMNNLIRTIINFGKRGMK